MSFAGLDLEVRSGEILGIAGVAGNGQDELLALLSGEVRLPRAQAERIRLGGCAARTWRRMRGAAPARPSCPSGWGTARCRR